MTAHCSFIDASMLIQYKNRYHGSLKQRFTPILFTLGKQR